MAIPEVIRKLLENGVHFGHLSKHWNPKMKKFIFGKKKNIYIIDLEKTADKIEEAKDYLRELAADGKKIMFVSTKKQLRELVREHAESVNMPYVVERWVGGFLTNYSTVRERVRHYVELLEKKEKGDFDRMPGKEKVRLKRELERMKKNYDGVTSLEDLPDCIYVVDPKKEWACIREATKLSIPLVALIDTDANPEVIDYPIPGNDDAIKSVRHITSCLTEAIGEGQEKGRSAAEESVSREAAGEQKEEAQAQPELVQTETKVNETAEAPQDKTSPENSQQKEE
ncbi:MAG: 30S ribosomal protein S2 [Candidatus Omnitrophica bacterium]|nr:30S ribosomal protein S2 [Candidatus Omnitrophota bacterium]